MRQGKNLVRPGESVAIARFPALFDRVGCCPSCLTISRRAFVVSDAVLLLLILAQRIFRFLSLVILPRQPARWAVAGPSSLMLAFEYCSRHGSASCSRPANVPERTLIECFISKSMSFLMDQSLHMLVSLLGDNGSMQAASSEWRCLATRVAQFSARGVGRATGRDFL